MLTLSHLPSVVLHIIGTYLRLEDKCICIRSLSRWFYNTFALASGAYLTDIVRLRYGYPLLERDRPLDLNATAQMVRCNDLTPWLSVTRKIECYTRFLRGVHEELEDDLVQWQQWVAELVQSILNNKFLEELTIAESPYDTEPRLAGGCQYQTLVSALLAALSAPSSLISTSISTSSISAHLRSLSLLFDTLGDASRYRPINPMYATTNWSALSRLSSLCEFRLLFVGDELSAWIKPLHDILSTLVSLPSITQLDLQTNWLGQEHQDPHELVQLIHMFEMHWKNDEFLPHLKSLVYQVGGVTPAHMSIIITRPLVTLSIVILPFHLLDRTQWKWYQCTTGRECQWHGLRTLDVTVAIDDDAAILNEVGSTMMTILPLDPICPNLHTLRLNWQSYFYAEPDDNSMLPVLHLFLPQSLQVLVINDRYHDTVPDLALQYINQLRSLVDFTLIFPESYSSGVFASNQPFINSPVFLSLKSLTLKCHCLVTMDQLESLLSTAPQLTWLDISMKLDCVNWACPLPLFAQLCTQLRYLSVSYLGDNYDKQNNDTITLNGLQQAFNERRLDVSIFPNLQSLYVPNMSIDALHWLLYKLVGSPLAYFCMSPQILDLGSSSTVGLIPSIRPEYVYVALQRLLPHLRQLVFPHSNLWTLYCQDHRDNVPVSPFDPSCDLSAWCIKRNSWVIDSLEIAQTRDVHRLYDNKPRFRLDLDDRGMDGREAFIRAADPRAMGSWKILAT